MKIKKSIYWAIGFIIFIIIIFSPFWFMWIYYLKGNLGYERAHGVYHLSDSSFSMMQNLHINKDSLVRIFELNPNTSGANHWEYDFLCNGEKITAHFLSRIENDEIYDMWIGGKEGTSTDEYNSLTKVYQQCYDSLILKKLK